MRETEDGFRISEEDLRCACEGDVLGGTPERPSRLQVADAAAHADLMAMARQDAVLAVQRDPGLTSGRGAALRMLLYLFRADDASGCCRRIGIICGNFG